MTCAFAISNAGQKRKAQNRAAQRAFRERKEQHLKDLETKVEELEKDSESANHENGLLRAQVDRLQVELKEYRKRLSWISINGSARPQNSSNQPKPALSGQSDFQFEFPKFGDLPAMSATKMFPSQKPQDSNTARSTTLPAKTNGSANGMVNGTTSRSNSQGQAQRQHSQSQSPLANNHTASPPQQNMNASVDSLTGLFSPSILEASRHASNGGYFPGSMSAAQKSRGSLGNAGYSNSSVSNTDSPGSSSESHNAVSSIGTSPEPSLNSPGNKVQELGLNTINEENPYGFGKDKICKEISRVCGSAEDPIPPILNMSNDESLGFGSTNGFGSTVDGFGSNNDISWMAQQNNGTFDPVLFGDYRDTQDNVLSQDFGTFFNDAYPLPDLGSPLHNYTEVVSEAPKVDLIRQVDAAKDGEEVVPDTDKPMSCNKIWSVDLLHATRLPLTLFRDRLQSMEKFRNGEIDIDNLCSELRAKAKCSEGGAVVDKKDVDKILGSAKV